MFGFGPMSDWYDEGMESRELGNSGGGGGRSVGDAGEGCGYFIMLFLLLLAICPNEWGLGHNWTIRSLVVDMLCGMVAGLGGFGLFLLFLLINKK